MATTEIAINSDRHISVQSLLNLVDKAGFEAVGAGWILERHSKRWFFLLVSPMIDTEGPKWVYQRLLKAFRKLHLPAGITPLDIVVSSPNEQSMLSLAKAFAIDDSYVFLNNLNLFGYIIDSAAFYRMKKPTRSTAEVARSFDKTVSDFVAA